MRLGVATSEIIKLNQMKTKEFKNGLLASFIKQILGGNPIVEDWNEKRFVYDIKDTDSNREWCKMYRVGIEE